MGDLPTMPLVYAGTKQCYMSTAGVRLVGDFAAEVQSYS